MTPIRVLAAVVLAILPAACISVATYPPTPGAPTIVPTATPGPEIMAAALKETHRVAGAPQPFTFNLPTGLDARTWTRVATLLPSEARPMREGDANVFSVQQIRLSGAIAEVDVVYPERGVYQLMTVKLEGAPFAGWRTQWTYRWVIQASAPVANDPRVTAQATEPSTDAAAKNPAETRPAPTEQASAPTDGNGG